MNVLVMVENRIIKDGEGRERVFQVKKLPVLTGLQLAKKVVARLLPLAQNIVSVDEAKQAGLREAIGKLDSSILDKIKLDQVATALDSLSGEDLEEITRVCLTRVSEVLDNNVCAVMDSTGFYRIEDVEYDPALFISLIWEELKFGLSDFFKGDRWASLLPEEPAET